jgi:TonB-linked SusC/RagA family outer membrane protein
MKKKRNCRSRMEIRVARKIFLTMKLTFLLLFIGMMQLSASVYSQHSKLSLDLNNCTVKEVLQRIEEQSEYRFFYNEKFIDLNRRVSVKTENERVEDILDEIFAGTRISYKVMENNLILITPREEDFTMESTQPRTVSGKVTDSSGAPLPGVTVIIRGTTLGVITDADGNFILSEVPADAILVFSFVGMKTREVPVVGRTAIHISMAEETIGIEEVVAIGYGTMKKSDLTGAVVSISSEKLNTTIANTFDQALQGHAAGMQVVNNSGQPGTATSVRIRGINSLQGSNEPLYVIDGVQFSGNGVSTISFGNTNGADVTNPLSSINPSDIESIEVLKDAAACAIYGNQGANGVILVTTKRGKANESRIGYEYSTGWKSLAKKIDVLSLQDYAEFTNELYNLKGLTPRPEFANPSSLTGGTDWQDEVFQVARNTKHQISLSGGTDKTTYYVGMGYQYDEGIVVNSWFERYNLRMNIENQTRSWLKIGANLSLSRSNNKLVMADTDNGPSIIALVKAPDIPAYNADGSFAGPNANQNTGGYASTNPVALTVDYDSRQKRVDIMANTYGEIKWNKFSLRNEVGATIGYINDFGFQAKVQYGEYVQATNKLLQKSSDQTNIEIKNILTYANTFNRVHNVNAMLAHESRMGRYDGLSASRSNFLSNSVNQMGNGDATTAANDGYGGNIRSESYLGRLFYNYNDLAMITASYRFDGSYKFAKGNRWGGFPSVSAALRLSNFDFLKSKLGVINNLKINGSYGETGNSEIPDYLYLSSVYFGNTSMGQGAYFTTPNPDITWETTKSANLGLEMGMYQNQITLQLEFYKKKTADALNRINLPQFMGSNMGTMVANGGSIENKGVEITLSTVNLSAGNFSWKTNFTFTLNRNKVLSLGEGGVPITGGGGQYAEATSYTIEGGPVGRFYGYVTDGLYQNLDDIITSARWSNNANDVNPKTGLWLGDQKFKDIDKTSTGGWDIVGYTGTVVDGKYVPGTAVYTGNPGDVIHLTDVSYIDDKDRTFIGNPNPKFIFSLDNTFTYRNFDLTVFVNGVYGNDILNINKRRIELMYSQNLNQSASIKNRALPVLKTGGDVNDPADYILMNPNSSVPRVRSDSNPGSDRISTRYIEDGSYIRIQNVVLGYTLPKSLVQRVRMAHLRVYANIQNLVTFTKYSGYDPEIGNQGQSSILQGVDNGHYPLARTYMFGVQVDF